MTASRVSRPNRLAASVASFAAALAAAGAASAQDREETPRNFVVLGAAALPEYDGADDQRIVPLVIASFSAFGARFEVEGIQGVNIDVWRHPVWRVGPSFAGSLPRDEDEGLISLVPDVDFGLEVGGFVGFETPVGGLPEGRVSGEVAVRQEVIGGHEGLVVKGDLDYFFAVSRQIRFQVGTNATFANNDYHESFFTVTPDTALASGLPAFDAGSGLRDVGAEVNMIYSFSPKYGLFVRGAYNRLVGDAADSSITEFAGDENQYFVGGGLFYSF